MGAQQALFGMALPRLINAHRDAPALVSRQQATAMYRRTCEADKLRPHGSGSELDRLHHCGPGKTPGHAMV
jgi:hypothetical protein